MKTRTRLAVAAAAVLALALTAAVALADSIGPITFEPPTYVTGNINGQNGWMKTGPYDVAVEATSGFPAAAGYGFGAQALRMSNAVTSGSFGDQTFSPGLLSPAGESGLSHFDATFSIGTTVATEQVGLITSISPDDGSGSRMSFLRFEDHTDGVHVVFADVTNPGPFPSPSSFNLTDIATLNRTSAHTARFSIDFKSGPANDVVAIYIDGVLEHTGTTWEDYYRYDPEQAGNGNVVPSTEKLLFREGGAPAPLTLGNGFLVDGVSLSSTALVGPPASKDECKNGGWQTFNNPTFENQGDCVSFVVAHGG